MFARVLEKNLAQIRAITDRTCNVFIRSSQKEKPGELLITSNVAHAEGATWATQEKHGKFAECVTMKLSDAREGDYIILLVHKRPHSSRYVRLVIAMFNEEDVKRLDLFLESFVNGSDGTLYTPNVQVATVDILFHG